MPVRTINIFDDVVSKFDKNCNVFVSKFLAAESSGNLPIAMGPRLREFPGRWREKFTVKDSHHRPKKLIVEIGCHTGHTICDMAEAHPDVLFVGVDITFKRVVQTAERATERGLSNVFAVLANAKGLDQLFHPGEVDGFVTFFPDPWKKKKHARNRLYSPEFCATIWNQLLNGGFLWLKTDQIE